MSLILKNIILNGEKKDIYIEGNKIKKIGSTLNLKADEKIDGKGEKAVLPGLINSHTHAAMTIFRGYGEDMVLKDWLEKKIWPLEAKLTEEDVYWGTKLACLEMIKTGTTCFNDMYWLEEATVRASEEMGVRAVIGLTVLDFLKAGTKGKAEEQRNILKKGKFKITKFSVAPHAVYTVSKENLIWAKNFAKKNNLLLHMHASETEEEVKNCQKKYKLRPIEFLEKIGFLNENVVLAHTIWLSDKEIEILKKRNCSVVYNPCSNLKLAAGGIFPFQKMKENNINVCLGTDGAASNNNLDLLEETKVGALLQKHREKNPLIANVKEVLDWATINGARALKINAGEIKEGKLADLILIDLKKTFFSPGHNFLSDVIYSGSGPSVSDSICNGRILMLNGKVEGEKEIIKKATKTAKNLVKKAEN